MKRSEERNNSNKLDDLIANHLKVKLEDQKLSAQFNSRLMCQIQQLNEAHQQIPVFTTKSLVVPILLLGFLVLFTFFYFYPGIVMGTNFGINVSFDTTIFQHNGAKYMLYSLAALMFFSLIDRFLQLKMYQSGK